MGSRQCRDDPGFDLLSKCNLADYVPRDLQQAGTAWLTVDLETLWEVSPNRPDRAHEWSLLEAARDYLSKRFFRDPEAVLIHTLASRAIANGLLTKGLTRTSLAGYLTDVRGDATYEKRFSPLHKARLAEVESWARLSNLGHAWTHVGRFHHVDLSTRQTPLDVEDFFTGRSGKARLSYPFNNGLSIAVEAESSDGTPRGPLRGRQHVAIDIHSKDRVPGNARPALETVLRISEHQGYTMRFETVKSLMEWFVGERVRHRTDAVDGCAGKILQEDRAELDKALKKLRERKSLVALNQHGYSRILVEAILSNRGLPNPVVGSMILGLPWSAMKSAPGKALLESTLRAAEVFASEGVGDRGAALEVATVANQWLSPDPCENRIVFSGATAVDAEGRDIAEWDVVRIDLQDGGDWKLVATECALSRTGAKNEEDRDRLSLLQGRTKDRFQDLAEFKSQLADLDSGSLRIDDAGRTYVRP